MKENNLPMCLALSTSSANKGRVLSLPKGSPRRFPPPWTVEGNAALSQGDPIGGERQETYIGAAPAGMLERRSLSAAGRAAGTLTQNIARSVGAPANDGN